jgi:hypothetical protein
MTSHGNGAFFAKSDGNHRVVQPVNTQDPVIITNVKPVPPPTPAKAQVDTKSSAGVAAATPSYTLTPDSTRGLFITFVILFGIAMIIVLVTCCLFIRNKGQDRVHIPNSSMEMSFPKKETA